MRAPLRTTVVASRRRDPWTHGWNRRRWSVAGAVAFAVLFCAFVGPSHGGAIAAPAGSALAPPGGSVPPATHADVAPGAASGGVVHRLATVSLDPARPDYLSSRPAWLAYDSPDALFYVAVPPSSVEVVPGDFGYNPVVIATIAVGSGPFGVAYDNATGDVFVTNSLSDNVSVISGSSMRLVTTIPVGTGPMGVAFDPVTRDIYVANNGSGNVSVISDTRLAVVATVVVGTAPLGVAADPSTGTVFVANHGSSNLSVISGTTNSLAATVALPSGPYGVTIDTSLHRVYVTEQTAANVSAISETTDAVLANISVPCNSGCFGLNLEGIGYDSGNGLVYVAGGPVTVVVILPSNETVFSELNLDPAGVVYDPDTGDICVTNTANSTFECAVFGHPPLGGPYTVQFTESGLPNGTTWYATVDGLQVQSTGTSIGFAVANGTYPYSIEASYTAPEYYADPSIGSVTIAGANVTVPTRFATGTYLVDVVETGLPAGTAWTAELGYWSSTSTSDTNWFNESNGTYLLTLGPALNYSASPTTQNVTVNGTPLVIAVAYSSPKEPHYAVTFTEVGLSAGTTWTVTMDGYGQGTPASSLTFNESNGTYAFLVAAIGYNATPANGTITVHGGARNQSIVFNSTKLWEITLHETGLPSGTDWGVLIGSEARSSTSSNLTFARVNGTYGYLVLPVAGYVTAAHATIVVNGSDQVVPVAFSLQLYPIVFVELGLPAGTNWSVTVVDNATGYDQSQNSTSSSIIFFLPNGTYQVTFTLPAGYNASVTSTSITVAGRAATGATVSVKAPAAATRRPSPTALSEFSDTGIAIALAACAVALLGVLLVVFRSRRPPTGGTRVA